MQGSIGETWRFAAEAPGAETVYLVKECVGGISSWLPMQPSASGVWEIVHRLRPGQYRFRYFRGEGETFINCGDDGLRCERIEGQDPHVRVDTVSRKAAVA